MKKKRFRIKDLFSNKIYIITETSEIKALKKCAKKYDLNYQDLVLVNKEFK